MVHTHPSAKQHKQPMDDLKQIHGIGSAMEERLHNAGIFTFAQIADMSADKLASLFVHMPGLSAERIIEKGWIQQAKKLSEKKSAVDTTKLGDDGQYSAVFSVDLLLDNQDQIRRTHIIHAQSREETNWAGWDQNKLVSFILKNARIKPVRSQAETQKAGSEPAGERQETDKKNSLAEIKGDLHLPEFEIRPENGQDAHWHMCVNRPFKADLKLDLSKTNIPQETLIHYQAFIYAKSLVNGQQQMIGENQGILHSANSIPIEVNCHALTQGTYRLEAYVTVSPDRAKLDPKSSLIAMTEGRIFRIS